MVRWCLSLLLISGLVILSNGTSFENPFAAMHNVMRRMETELQHASSSVQMNKQLVKFKNHVKHIVRIHLISTAGMPPPAVVTRLNALMNSQMGEMDKHMRQLMIVVHNSFGIQKVHLLMKKVREHCNHHIVKHRQRLMTKLKEKPKKYIKALNSKWTEAEAKAECRKRGGHLATIASNEEHFLAIGAVKNEVTEKPNNYYINIVHAHGMHGMWFLPSLRSWFQRSKSLKCAMLDISKKGIMTPVSCETKQGALCEFLSFNPYIRHVGKRVFFVSNRIGTFNDGEHYCKNQGGKIATIHGKEDRKMVNLILVRAPAFITLSPSYYNALLKLSMKNGGRPELVNSPVAMMSKKQMPLFTINHGDFITEEKRKRQLPTVCEVRVVPDTLARAERPNAMGKVFIAFNNKTDLFSKKEAINKCYSIGGNIARIRSNTQQLAAISALHHRYPVRIDRLSGKTKGWYHWSDATRLPMTQVWRIQGANMEEGVSINKYGEWNPAIGKMGVLCEIVHVSGDKDSPPFGFKTEIRMNINFNDVTKSVTAEKIFTRALEDEVHKQSSVNGKGVKEVVVISLHPGSTIANIRVWTESSGAGRPEAEALQNSLITGKFRINFMGRIITPTPNQMLRFDFDVTICIFNIPIPTKYMYYIIPVAIAVLAFTMIVALVSLLRSRKRRRAKVDTVFTVDKEKELFAKEEEKGALAAADAPPPYPENEDTPPDYDSCLASENVKI